MDRIKKIVKAFLNSGEGYFHTKRVLQDQVKQPRDLYGPMSDRPERWNYKDIRDIDKMCLDQVLSYAYTKIDWDLFNTIPSTALHAALQYAIDTYAYGQFQSKFDANMYNFLLKALAIQAKNKGKKK